MRTLGLLTLTLLLCSAAAFAEQSKQKNADANIDIKIDTSVPDVKITHMVKPKYPDAAKQKGLQGQVVLRVAVNDRGTPAVEVVSGDPVLAAAAVDAVTLWRYKPHKKDGKTARFENRVTLTFTMPTA